MGFGNSRNGFPPRFGTERDFRAGQTTFHQRLGEGLRIFSMLDCYDGNNPDESDIFKNCVHSTTGLATK